MLDPLDVVRILLRWVHALAAVAWVGGALFYLLVLRPALRARPAPELERRLAAGFREVVQAGIAALVVSGVFLTADRLSQGVGGALYAGLLGLKIALALGMFGLAWWLARGSGPRLARRWHPASVQLGLGLLIFLLVAALRVVYENGLRTGAP